MPAGTHSQATPREQPQDCRQSPPVRPWQTGQTGRTGEGQGRSLREEGQGHPWPCLLRLLPAPGKTDPLRGPVPVQARLCPKPAGHRGLAVPRLCSPAIPWSRLRRTAGCEARLPGERGLVLGMFHSPAFQMLRQDQGMAFQTGLADGGKARTRPGSSRAIHAPAHAVPDWAKTHCLQGEGPAVWKRLDTSQGVKTVPFGGSQRHPGG